MRVLVTGSSGRVGSAIVQSLASAHEVTGLDLKPGAHTSVRGDVAAYEGLDSLVAGFDAVVHTASLHAPHVGAVEEPEFRRVNVEGTQRLLQACLRHGVRRFVYTSTTSVYGNAMVVPGAAAWVTEELQPQPRDIYDETKLAAEAACAEAARAGLPCIALRMSRCFPEREDLMAIHRLHRGVDVRDVAQAHALALASALQDFHVFNISALPPFRRADAQALAADAPAVIARYHPWAPREFSRRGWTLPASLDRVYVVSAARAALGYEPRHNFESLFPERDAGRA